MPFGLSSYWLEAWRGLQPQTNAVKRSWCQGFKHASQCLHTSELEALYVGEFKPNKSACNTVAAGRTSPRELLSESISVLTSLWASRSNSMACRVSRGPSYAQTQHIKDDLELSLKMPGCAQSGIAGLVLQTELKVEPV